MYSFTLFSSYLVFTTLLLPFLPENIHLCKSVNLVFRAHFTETRWNILFILVFLSCNLFSKSNCGSFLTFFHTFCMILLTEFKIKWLVNLIAFFSALFFFRDLVDDLQLDYQPWFHKALYFYLTYIFTQQKFKKMSSFCS